MASFTSRLMGLLLMLLMIGLATCGRGGKGPLLVEDEGNRRQRPAGEFLRASFISNFKSPLKRALSEKRRKKKKHQLFLQWSIKSSLTRLR